MFDRVLLCSELLQESESTGRQQEQRQPEETGMCVCGGGDGVRVDVHPCVCRWDGVRVDVHPCVCV